MTQLDQYSSVILIQKYYRQWIDICLSNPNISHEEKYCIARFGNDEHRTRLLDHHELNHNTKSYIAYQGTHEHRTKLRKMGYTC